MFMKKLFIILFLLLPTLVFAENTNNYLVENLYISMIDEDATTARSNAITYAQRQAFNTILNRLGIDTSNSVIISDNEISQMLRSMQIKNEKITTKSYSATLTLQFSPEYIKYTLSKYKISQYSPHFDSYLIVPVIKNGDNIYLWEKENKWLDPLTRNARGTTGVLVIKDNYSTRNLIDLEYFKKPKYNNFKKLASLYGTNNVVLVVGEENKEDKLIDTKIYVLNENKATNAYLKYEMKDKNIDNDYYNASIEIVKYIDGLLVEDKNKTEYNVIDRNDGYINIYAPLSSIQDYINVKHKLAINKDITQINLKMISQKMAVFTVKYSSNINNLVQSLKNIGFTTSNKKEGIYVFLN